MKLDRMRIDLNIRDFMRDHLALAIDEPACTRFVIRL